MFFAFESDCMVHLCCVNTMQSVFALIYEVLQQWPQIHNTLTLSVPLKVKREPRYKITKR